MHHIKACRSALLQHLENCPKCRQYELKDWPDCLEGRAALDEYKQAIALRVDEHLEATPCTG